MNTITREQLKAKMDRGDHFALVEALPEEYYRRSHLPGALLIPADKVGDLAPKLLPAGARFRRALGEEPFGFMTRNGFNPIE